MYMYVCYNIMNFKGKALLNSKDMNKVNTRQLNKILLRLLHTVRKIFITHPLNHKSLLQIVHPPWVLPKLILSRIPLPKGAIC